MRSDYVPRAKKWQLFSSLEVAFSSLDVRISSLAIQQGKAKSLLLFSLLYRQGKNPQSGGL
jgi:hypothetical protein